MSKKQLARPKNFRIVRPRVCGFCRYYAAKAEGWFCDREGIDGLRRPFGTYSWSPFRHTCDGFAKPATDVS